MRRWQGVSQGEGRVVVLTGDPGIGNRTFPRASRAAPAEPHVSLRYFCSAHHTHSALFPFVGQLERAAQFKRSDTPAEKLAKLDSADAVRHDGPGSTSG